MAFTFGARSRENIRFGPASVYIADGGQAITSLTANFAETISKTAFDTNLVTNFHYMGTLSKNPSPQSEPIPVKLLSPTDGDIRYDTQQKSKVECSFEVLEVDNAIFNNLVSYAEARTLVDILWLRESIVGEYVSFLRNVPILVGFQRGHSWDIVEKVTVNVNVETFVLRKVTGQKQLT